MAKNGFFLSLVAAALLLARDAHATDPATAQTLFDQARKLMAQERWAEACPKLEESQRLDPGGGTLLHLALCREHEGKIATAWATYQEALATARRDNRKDRAKIAQARIEVLQARLPKMRIKVSGKNRKLAGFRVTRDEAVIGEAQWGESFPVDPGTRTISARADGYKAWSTTVDVAIANTETTIDIPDLEAEEATPPSTQPATSGEKPPVGDAPDPRAGDTQRTLGLVVGGVGVVSVVVGSVFGFMSIAKHSEADEKCKAPDFKLCSRAGIATGEDADTLGNVSTIAFIAGGLFVVGGAALYFTAPSSRLRAVRVAPQIGVQGGGLSLRSSF